MNDIQSIKLASFIDEGGEKPTPELCEHLGSKAAQLAIDANIVLSDAVVKVASDQSGLNNNHINNICWEANNEYFRKVAVAKKEAGEDLTFDYQLADPPDVAKRLNAAANPKVSFVTDPDFLTPPSAEKVAEDGMLQKFFGKPGPEAQKQLEAIAKKRGKGVGDLKGSDFPTLPDRECVRGGPGPRGSGLQDTEGPHGSGAGRGVKTSSADYFVPGKYAQDNALRQLGELREVLVRASQQTREKAASIETHVILSEARLYKLFKQAAISGTPLGYIVDLFNQHHDGDNAVVAEVSKLSHKLAGEEPFFFRRFQKTASIDPVGKADTEHPLYHAYSSLRSSRRESAYMTKAAEISTAEATLALREEGKLVAKHMSQ